MAERSGAPDLSDATAYFDRCARDGVMACFEPQEEQKVRALLQRLDLRPGQRVLEAGCGSGRLTERLARVVGSEGFVYAFDLSLEMIKHARKRGLPPHVKIEVADAGRLDVESGHFDACICFNVFPHFSDKVRVLDEMARVLKIDGEIWVAHLKHREELNAFHQTFAVEVASHMLPADQEMRALLTGAGFGDVRIVEDENGYALCATLFVTHAARMAKNRSRA